MDISTSLKKFPFLIVLQLGRYAAIARIMAIRVLIITTTVINAYYILHPGN